VTRIRFAWQQLGYDLDSGLISRPLTILAACAALGAGMPAAELAWLPELSARLATEPSSAQALLGTVAGSMMSVVSVVYSILLVALSLASMQFSTRVLASMMRDRVSQNTLGLFLGTFVYCLLVLRSVHTDPAPYVPGVALALALALALSSLVGLVYFIHHIVRGIQANHLVDRLATETEAVIDDVFRSPWVDATVDLEPPPCIGGQVIVPASYGYVQLVDIDGLGAVAGPARRIQVLRAMGSFAPAGAPLLRAARVGASPAASGEVLTPDEVRAALACIDLGPARTMQMDVEFGIRQVVDVALKAISPAVNDPSTAATCIDHLGRVLIRVAGRAPVPFERGGVVTPAPTHAELVDLAFEQIRQYARTDMAVALRLMRTLADVAYAMRSPAARARIVIHARLVETAARANFPPEDTDELTRRSTRVAELCG